MDAQATTGSIVGSVRDAGGLSIFGAKVELVHLQSCGYRHG
jgi:hypothetical protein